MRLIVLHYHDRPGGVRSVIEQCLPALVRAAGPVRELVFAAGEIRDRAWLRRLAERCGMPITTHEHPALGYTAGRQYEDAAAARNHTRWACDELLGRRAQQTLVWAHNLSIGRNAALAAELPDACARESSWLILHQHDWWFDGRWDRTEEFPALGLRSAEEICAAFFPSGPHIRTVCINRPDAEAVQRVSGAEALWLPHPVPDLSAPRKEDVRRARRWLEEWTGGAPVWLYPCRWLRRKNVAEALLLARALTEDAFLCTTGGPSSPGEADSWEHLRGAASAAGWRYLPGIFQTGERTPPLPALMAAADALVHTSVREGFGLVPVEAALLERPLLLRRTAVAHSLAPLDLFFPWGYESLPVPRAMLRDVPPHLAEAERGAIRRMDFVKRMFGTGLPCPAAENAATIDFGRLDLWSQISVLNAPLDQLRQLVSAIPPEPPAAAVLPIQYAAWDADAWAERLVAHVQKPAEYSAEPGGPAALLQWITQHPPDIS